MSTSGLRFSRIMESVFWSWSEPAHREILALHGDDHLVGRGQCVHRQESQRRRRIDADEVVIVVNDPQRLVQRALAADLHRHRDLGSGEVDRGHRDVDLAAADDLRGSACRAPARRTSTRPASRDRCPATSSGSPAGPCRCTGPGAPPRRRRRRDSGSWSSSRPRPSGWRRRSPWPRHAPFEVAGTHQASSFVLGLRIPPAGGRALQLLVRIFGALLLALAGIGCSGSGESVESPASRDARAAMETAKRWQEAWLTGQSEAVCSLMSGRAQLEVAEPGVGCAGAISALVGGTPKELPRRPGPASCVGADPRGHRDGHAEGQPDRQAGTTAAVPGARAQVLADRHQSAVDPLERPRDLRRGNPRRDAQRSVLGLLRRARAG